MIYQPKPGTFREQLCIAILKKGSMQGREVIAAFPNVEQCNVWKTLSEMVSRDVLSRSGHSFSISDAYRAYFEDLVDVPVAYVGEIVPPRDMNVLNRKPWACNLSSAARRADALPPREISFVNGSSGYQVTGYLA